MICKNCQKKFEYGEHTPKAVKATGICLDCLNKPFEVSSVCRIDLMAFLTPKKIAKFDDNDMKHLASKMGDAYCDGGYWETLEMISEYILEDK